MPESADARPRGVTPYLNVDGAAKASEFYQRAFGAEEIMRVPDQDGARLLHCLLKVNDGDLMISDCFPEMGISPQPSNNFTMHLQVEDIDMWWARAVEAGAEVLTPVELMFWGDRYGTLRDPFGVQWSMGQNVGPFQAPDWSSAGKD